MGGVLSFNVIVFHEDPATAASMLTDDHVVSAPVHAVAALEGALRLRRWTAWKLDPTRRLTERVTMKGAPHPRHLITRYAAAHDPFARWVAEYGAAACSELEYRGLRTSSKRDPRPDVLGSSLAALTAERPVDPVGNVWVERDSSIYVDGYPQRLDGGEDLAVHGDAVAGYRRWFAETRVPGALRAWAGAQATWTRREPPAWLAEYGVHARLLPADPADRWPVWTVSTC